jgi:hypothetical protein
VIPEEALQIVLSHLDDCGIAYMITGSFASNVHGVPRTTQDADVIIETGLERLVGFIEGLGSDFYADSDVAKEAFSGNRMLNIIHMPTGFKIDLVLRKERPFSKEEFQRRQQVEFLGQPRWFASSEDIILAKLEWSKMGQSERQFADAISVAKVQRDALDRAYLKKWAQELGVDHLLEELFSALD